MEDHFTKVQNSLRTVASAFTLENEQSTFATSYLSPPPLQFLAEQPILEKKESGEESVTTEIENDPINTHQVRNDEDEIEEEGAEEISESESAFDSGGDDLPDDDGEDNGADDNPQNNQNSNDFISRMEASFGTEFSNVNMVQNSSIAEQVSARAFTIGESIHFASGEFNLHSTEGQELIAHELTHVVQQRQGRVSPTNEQGGFQINDDPRLEREADEMGSRAVQGELLPFNLNRDSGQSNPAIQRKVIQRVLNENQLNNAVEGVHNVCDQHNAVRIIRENREDLEQIKTGFQARYETSLRSFIRHNYNDIDMKVKATALLFDPTYNLPWTQIALALIPPLTRDGEFFRIMSNQTNEGRRELRRKYNARFSNIGEGGLDADIRSDFEGEEEMRAWILSYRALTDADNIYLDTAGQYGTNVTHLIATLRRLWGYGVNTFDQKLNQWNPNHNLPDVEVANSSPIQYLNYFQNAPEVFSGNIAQIGSPARSLMYTVLEELSGSSFRNAEQIFIQYVEQKGGPARAETGGWAFTREEESDLRIARQRLEGGESWIDDTEEINSAVDEIIAIYQRRVSRLEAIDNNDENVHLAREALTNVRTRLVRDHGAESLRVAERNMADEVYFVRGNRSSLENKILDYFKAGQLAALIAETAVPHEENGEVIRPAFRLQNLLNISQGRSGAIYNIIEGSGSDSEKAGRFVHDIITREYVQASTLTFLHGFINQGTWNSSLKTGMLTFYCQRHASRNAVVLRGSAENAFVFHLHGLGFRRFSTWPSFRDALAPSLSNNARVARAREDLETEESSTLGNISTDIYDAVSGEDTREVAHTSLENLELFANRARANSAEMEAFRSFYGEELDLVSREYRLFHERLSAMRTARNEVASLASSVVSTILETVLTPFISPIGAAIVSQAVGILTEWAINPEAEPVTAANIATVLTAGVTAGAGRLLESEAVIGRMLQHQISNRYLRTAVSEAIEQSFQESANLFTQGVSGELDRQSILNSVESILARSVSGGLVNGRHADDVTRSVISHTLSGMTASVIQEGVRSAEHVILQPGDTEPDFSRRIARVAFDGALSGALESAEGGSDHGNNETTEHENSSPTTAPSHDEGHDGHRDAILPPAPIDPERVPQPEPEHEDHHDTPNGDHDSRDTEVDVETADTIPAPTPEIEGRDTHEDIETAETIPSPEVNSDERATIPDESPSHATDLHPHLLPDAEYTQGAISRPQGVLVNHLTGALSANENNSADIHFVLDHIIADTRFYLASENNGILYPFSTMGGQCGLARDISASLLEGMTSEPGIEARRMTAYEAFNQVVPDYSGSSDHDANAGSSSESNTGTVQHAFTIARFPNGHAFIVDPSFSQFVSGGLTPQDNNGRADHMNFPADQHLSSEVNGRLASQLLERGYIPLTPENAFSYSQLIGYEGPLTGEDMMTNMLAGAQDTENALDRTELRGFIVAQAAATPEGSEERARFESISSSLGAEEL